MLLIPAPCSLRSNFFLYIILATNPGIADNVQFACIKSHFFAIFNVLIIKENRKNGKRF
jgi:hypothetical protein